LTGDYHLLPTSALVDRGVRCSNTAFPAPASALNPCSSGAIQAPASQPSLGGIGDFDSQFRPMLRSLRIRTPWDLGADELPGLPLPLPGLFGAIGPGR
jgi:hypothetical protein